jgi:hypothetical protein
MERSILIEIEEPDFMDLIDLKEREELKSKVAEAIRSRVSDLFTSEMKKIVRERYNLLTRARKNSRYDSYLQREIPNQS